MEIFEDPELSNSELALNPAAPDWLLQWISAGVPGQIWTIIPT
jgi:hypothetical protein